MGEIMNNINTIKVAFAGYNPFNEKVHKTIIGQSFKYKTSIDIEVYRILIQKEKDKDVIISFTTDFEEIVLDYFDVLIFSKVYNLHDHKTVSLARQSLTTGKDLIITDPEFIEIYGNNVRGVAATHGLRIEQAYTIDHVIKSIITIASYRAKKVDGVDAR